MKEEAQHKKESIFGDGVRILSLEKAWTAAKLGGIGAGIGFLGTAIFILLLFRTQQNNPVFLKNSDDYKFMIGFSVICLGLWAFWGCRMCLGKGIYSSIFALLFMLYEAAWKIISSGGTEIALLQIAACYCFFASFRGNLFIKRNS